MDDGSDGSNVGGLGELVNTLVTIGLHRFTLPIHMTYIWCLKDM